MDAIAQSAFFFIIGRLSGDCLTDKADKRKFQQQAFIPAGPVIQVTCICQLDRLEQQPVGTALRHLLITFTDRSADLEQDQSSLILADQQITEMRCQASYDILPVKSFAQYIVQDQDADRTFPESIASVNRK